MNYGQEYVQGIVIQRSEKGSAFQQTVEATVDEQGTIKATLPGGIKEVVVTAVSKEGQPVEVEELPEASEEYENLIYLYASNYYVCSESDGEYNWVKLVPETAEEPEE